MGTRPMLFFSAGLQQPLSFTVTTWTATIPILPAVLECQVLNCYTHLQMARVTT